MTSVLCVAKMNPSSAPTKQREILTSTPGFLAWLAGMIAVTLVFAFQPLYPDAIGPLSNILPTACVTVTFLTSLTCLRRYGYGLHLNFEAVWLLFTLGTGLWVLAEGTWAF